MCRFLIVEDNSAIREMLRNRLKVLGHEVAEVDTEQGAIEQINQNGINCMLLDIMLREGNGLNVVAHLQKNSIYIPTIIMTGSEISVPKGAESCGVFGLIKKPFNLERLINVVNKAAKSWSDINAIIEMSHDLQKRMFTFNQNITQAAS